MIWYEYDIIKSFEKILIIFKTMGFSKYFLFLIDTTLNYAQ